MGYRIVLTPPDSQDPINLVENEWTTGLRAGSLQGMVAHPTDITETMNGWPGQILQAQNLDRMEGSFTVDIAGTKRRPAGKLWRKLRRAFHHFKPTTITIHTFTYGTVHAEARLAKPLDNPTSEPDDEDALSLSFNIVCDYPAWLTDPRRAEGTAVVDNFGDLPVSPRVRWSGSGGSVVLPSGASFVLPPVSGERTLLLDSMESLEVIGPDGLTDYDTMVKLVGALPERVPPGTERTFVLPVGAAMEWRLGFFDPWR